MTKAQGWKSEYEKKWYAKHRGEQLLKMKAWREANPEKMKAAHQRWNATHKEQNKQTHKEYRKKNRDRVRGWKNDWYEKHPERKKSIDRNTYFKREHGITLETYERMIQERNNKCDICGSECNKTTSSGKKLEPCVDHNHKTNELRGLLCTRCNQTLGKVEDNTELLSKMIDYLNRTRGSGN